jgi:hypothetical protein
MTAQLLQAMQFAALKTAFRRFLGALDDFAAAKMRNAVPEQELRRAEREIDRYRRLMHATHAAAAKTPPPRLIF